MALIYQPSKRIFCGWFEPLKSTTYSEYPVLIGTLSLALAHRIFIGPTEKFDAQSVMNKIRDEAAPLIGRIALFSSVLIGIALIAKGVIE